MKIVLTLGFMLLASWRYGAQTQLVVPDTLSGPNISLVMHKDSVQFFPGAITQTYAYNQYSYLGPTLIFQQGQTLDITVSNAIQDTTTVHWHGIHLPAIWDGGPHTMIMDGEIWNPQFTVLDHAATYWYHPHMHMKTAEQAIKGAAGFIIVRDANEASLNLPRSYGVDDFPLVVQSQQHDSFNQAMPLGMQDSILLVNGSRANYNGHSVFANFPAQMVRLRLLNGSGERVFNFGLSNDAIIHQIGSDGGLLNSPFPTTRVQLAPGERAEILLDLNGLIGQSLQLVCYGSELPMGVQGGPTMPMPPGSPPMDSPLNGVDYNILQINVVAQTANAITSIPPVLNNDQAYSINDSDVSRTVRFTADSIMVMDGPFYFNDSSFDMDRIDFIIPINNTEIWKLVNETMVGHPFHIHDVQFYIFERNDGLPPLPSEAGRKDVVYIPTGDSLRFITRFDDFSDSIVPYMYHCHILMHEDAGMMGQFLVVPADYVQLNSSLIKTTPFVVYPNPVESVIHWDAKWEVSKIRVVNSQGKVVFKSEGSNMNSLFVEDFPNGMYTIIISSDFTYYSSQFIKK